MPEPAGRTVRQSGSSLGEILGHADQTAALVADMAAASTDQVRGIAQVSAAVADMDEVTQEAARQSEQLSDTARVPSSRAADARGWRASA